MKIGDIVTKGKYTDYAVWCNKQGDCHIEKQDGKYVVVANPEPVPVPVEPTQLDRIEAQVMFTAMMTDTLIDAEEESADV